MPCHQRETYRCSQSSSRCETPSCIWPLWCQTEILWMAHNLKSLSAWKYIQVVSHIPGSSGHDGTFYVSTLLMSPDFHPFWHKDSCHRSIEICFLRASIARAALVSMTSWSSGSIPKPMASLMRLINSFDWRSGALDFGFITVVSGCCPSVLTSAVLVMTVVDAVGCCYLK